MVDVAKMSEGLSRPGIDPRMFVDLAIVTHVLVDDGGCHYDVTTIGGMNETVALSPPYGGSRYGFYFPVFVDQMATLVVPDGKFNAGARMVGATWDPGTPPPQEAVDHPDDVALVVQPGQTVRIIVSGGGNAVIEARDGGKVKVGSEDADSPALNGIDGADFVAALQAALLVPPVTGTGQEFGANLLAQLQSLPPTTVAHSGAAWPVGASKVDVK